MKAKEPFGTQRPIYQTLLSLLARATHLFHKRAVLILTMMFTGSVIWMLWYMSFTQSNLIDSIALQNASAYSLTLEKFRTLYTSEVVNALQNSGIEVTHDYASKKNAIPLPATLSMLLGKSIGEHASGVQTRLYSAYPFPWREGLQDQFGKEAWSYLSQKTNQPFYRFEDFQGRLSLRYAKADLMRPSCVNCHNSHPDSPKRDWQAGDVRGVLEVILPVDAAVTETRKGLQGIFAIMVFMSILGLSALSLVITRLRQASNEAYRHADETKRTNQELEREITERKQAENALQEKVQELDQERNMLSGIINNIPDFIYVKNKQHQFVITNEALAKTLGAPFKEDMIGKTDYDYLSHEEVSGYHTVENEVMKSEKNVINYEESAMVHGKEVWHSSTKVPWRDAQGNVTNRIAQCPSLFSSNDTRTSRTKSNGGIIGSNPLASDHRTNRTRSNY